jgi:dihydrofolate reductase
MYDTKFNIILASDANYGISKVNNLPWKISEDLKYFNKVTSHFSFDEDIIRNTVIMGYNTVKEIGKPLPNRHNIMLRSKGCYGGGFIVETDFDEALERGKSLSYPGKEIFVIGGAKNFNHSLKHEKLDKIYYTHINKNYECDNFVDSILGRDDMVYDIINKEKCIDKNTNEEVELTYYLIIPKVRFERDYKEVNTFTIETTLDCLDDIKSTKKVYEVLGNSTKNSNITSKIKRNDMIHFKNGGSCMTTKVLEVIRYMTFEQAIKKIDYKKIYPNIVDEKEAIDYFDSIFSITKQKSQSGIFMIKFEVSY